MTRNEAGELPELELETHPEITTALLTCIAAGYKHLIIRTHEEDIGRVKGLVISALSSLNAPLTQRLRAKEHHTPLSFLRNVLITQSGHTLDHSFASVHGGGSKPAHSPARSKHRAVSPAGSPIRPVSYPGVQPLEQLQARTFSLNNPPSRPHSVLHRRNPIAPRVPHALVVSHLEVASRAVQQTLVDTLRTRFITIDTDTDENVETSIGTGRWGLPVDFLVVYVHPGGRDDRERSPVIKPLVTKRITEATNAIRLPLPLQIYMSSLMSAARHHHQLDGTFLTLRAQRDFEILLKASSVVTHIFPTAQPYETGAELAPSAVDAAKLFMRVVTHRLRVRNGPQSELLSPLLWEAENDRGVRSVPSLGIESLEHTRRTICDIIVEDILTTV
ncbi:hypothetical protein FRC06_005573 [Ceratobasidium sp. 370]|nr:hypothetical protein FRC06_005573 [Ceratobasidium sp. 370]